MKLWYQQAVFYQLHVKCFRDSNGDGIGDFKGLIETLDYIQSLGCTALWLQPFYPSPQKDDGYDISDYTNINPDYGTLKDFKEFLKAAHARDLKVVTELVINHTSDQHPWFQRARRAKPKSKFRNYYVWSDTTEKFEGARIIFQDFETSNWTWDPVANAYYWHRFYSHQPDLNYDNPQVHKEIFKALDFWFGMGVDGLRLDAIPYLYEREGTDCENLAETHAFLKKLRAHVDKNYENRMLLAEANQWPDQAVAYFGNGDECHMAFHFPVMPRLFMAIRMEDRFPILDIMEQTPTPPEGCQWATFLRNHDELTLEMVTDEERDYMYRAYAKDPRSRINLGIRRRLAPLLDNDRKKIEMMNILLFSLPGSPIIYYGDEIGMGDNYYLGDRNGVRTSMQWNTDRNAGFSDGNPQQLYLPLIIDPQYHHAWLNVESQDRTINSLLWWMRQVILIRKKTDAFGKGSLAFLQPANGKILAFIREYEGERILVVANLSRHPQYVELHLPDDEGAVARDLFSNNLFSKVRRGELELTLGGYGYFLLQLEKEMQETVAEQKIPILLEKDWKVILQDEKILLRILPPYLEGCRWFSGKRKKITRLKILEKILLGPAKLCLIEAVFSDSGTLSFFLPIMFISHESAHQVTQSYPQAVIAAMETGILIDALYNKEFQETFLDAIVKRKIFKGTAGSIVCQSSRRLKKLLNGRESLTSHILSVEQSNSSIEFDNLLFLKFFRRIEEGINPDAELTRFLSEEVKFPSISPYAGSIEWEPKSGKGAQLALLQEYIPNAGTMWTFTVDNVLRFFDSCLVNEQDMEDSMGWMFLETIALLGKRTAQMHLALAKGERAELKPEHFSPFYQKSLYQSMRGQLKRVFAMLKEQVNVSPLIGQVLALEKQILSCFQFLLDTPIDAWKMRIHGDFHLGQVLSTGKDLVIIDFEGEPEISVSERRLKKCCLQDVAGMVRSFDYALMSSLDQRKEFQETLTPYLPLWFEKTKRVFLHAYFDPMSQSSLLPKDEEQLFALFRAYLLHKAIYEIGYEIVNRPDWINIPLRGILGIMEDSHDLAK